MTALVLIVAIAGGAGGPYLYHQLNQPPNCSDPLGGAKVLRTHLSATTFGGVTEFALPSPLRDPNAPVVAPDGSLWFAEQSVPGLAHFYPSNGTLVEYAWPYQYSTPPYTAGDCAGKTDIWGVALWDGKVWSVDTTGNQLVSLDPSTGSATSVKIPSSQAYPYTLTPGPGNTLWFTELFASKLGVLFSNGTIREYPLPGGTNAVPSQIVFANSTVGYYVDVGEGDSENGGIYSFNVNHFAPALVGGAHLNIPTSIALGSDAIWVALHGQSSVGAYNLTTKSWSYYPTSYVSWITTTLPYFVQTNGSLTWFNEHYGNRIARVDSSTGTVTEYSESDQPVNGTTIGNTVTFALGGGRAWFVEWSGNVIGYVDASYSPGFSTSVPGNRTLTIAPGHSATTTFEVSGKASNLSIRFADNETFSSMPAKLNFTTPTPTIQNLDGEATVTVTVTASTSLPAGTYAVLLTATDGLTFESSVIRVVVP